MHTHTQGFFKLERNSISKSVEKGVQAKMLIQVKAVGFILARLVHHHSLMQQHMAGNVQMSV